MEIEFSDQEAIKKIKSGYINYFEILVKKYSPKFLNYVRLKTKNSDDAEDIIQNSFIKLYKGLDNFDEKRPLPPYFYSIVNNEIAEFYKNNPKELILKEEIVPLTNTLEEEYFNEDDFFGNLKEEYKKALKLYSQGFSYKEISKKLKKPLNTIKTFIRRAKIEVSKNGKR